MTTAMKEKDPPRHYPIIAWPFYEDTIPQWLKEQIITDRLAPGENNTEETATDSEALAYLIGASLAMPLGHSWTQIYLYCFTKTMATAGKKVPQDLQSHSIEPQERQMLNQLKDWIRKQQKKAAKNMENKAKATSPQPEKAKTPAPTPYENPKKT